MAPIEDIIMNGEFLREAAKVFAMDCPEIQLLAEGLIWRQKNMSFMQNSFKLQGQKIFFKYHFGDARIGAIQTDLERSGLIFLPEKKNIFLRVLIKNMSLKIFLQLTEEKKFLPLLENPQQEELILGMCCGDSLVDNSSQDPTVREFIPEVTNFRDKINRIFRESVEQNPFPRITSLGGIPFISKSLPTAETFFFNSQLIFFPIEFSIFEITSLIWQRIFEKSKKRIFSKVVFVDRDEFVFQCPKNIVESQKIQQIIHQVGQEVLPFSGLSCEISQLEKLEN